MRDLYRWTVGKEAEESPLNEDACLCRPAQGVYAISDGASESYASRRWARVLVSRYVRKQHIDAGWLEEALAVYGRFFDREAMSWSAQGSFDRGSFATLLGLKFDRDRRGVAVIGIGDSLAVLDDGDRIHASFPYTDAAQFRANPLLLSTIGDRNHAVFDTAFSISWRFDGLASPKLFCMTDAIGAWLLSEPDGRMEILRGMTSRDQFVRMVNEARGAGTMRTDDTTLLVIG